MELVSIIVALSKKYFSLLVLAAVLPDHEQIHSFEHFSLTFSFGMNF